MKGQVLLIIVFTLTFALFSVFMLLAPIKDKLLRIKDIENVYQAVANSEKGLEVSLLDVFVNFSASLNKSTSTFADTDCGGLNLGLSTATCTQIVYTPRGSLWRSDEIFINNTFQLYTIIDGEIKILIKSISDSFSGKAGRTVIFGPQ
jgi:hypothetical protein